MQRNPIQAIPVVSAARSQAGVRAHLILRARDAYRGQLAAAMRIQDLVQRDLFVSNLAKDGNRITEIHALTGEMKTGLQMLHTLKIEWTACGGLPCQFDLEVEK